MRMISILKYKWPPRTKIMTCKHSNIRLPYMSSGFFPWGLGGFPIWQKINQFPHVTLVHFFFFLDQSCLPLTEICLSKFLLNSDIISCLKHQKWFTFLSFGIRTFPQVLPPPPHPESSQMRTENFQSPPPSKYREQILGMLTVSNYYNLIKRALDKCNIIPNFFNKKKKKKLDFYTIRSVGMGNDCMLSFTF